MDGVVIGRSPTSNGIVNIMNLTATALILTGYPVLSTLSSSMTVVSFVLCSETIIQPLKRNIPQALVLSTWTHPQICY
jgi:hypothetical protein